MKSTLTRLAIAPTLALSLATATQAPFIAEAEAAPRGFRCDVELRPARGQSMQVGDRTYRWKYYYNTSQFFGKPANVKVISPRSLSPRFNGRIVRNMQEAEKFCNEIRDAIVNTMSVKPRSATAKVTPR